MEGGTRCLYEVDRLDDVPVSRRLLVRPSLLSIDGLIMKYINFMSPAR